MAVVFQPKVTNENTRTRFRSQRTLGCSPSVSLAQSRPNQLQGRPLTSVLSAAVGDQSSSSAQQQRKASARAREQITKAWDALKRWAQQKEVVLSASEVWAPVNKVAVLGGGSFATAMGCILALQKEDVDVVLLVRDAQLCSDINVKHMNTKYLEGFPLPPNMRATTDAVDAIVGAQFVVHAVPVQGSRMFLAAIRDALPASTPLLCVSKGLEVSTGSMMSELIPSALGRKQPAVFLSGPSFAREVMERQPTGLVAASTDPQLAASVQALLSSPTLRVNTSADVVGIEICGALKNVLAVGAGIVQGLGLGQNALAAFIVQGCSEIRWLVEALGGKASTINGLGGIGDICLTCYGSLSRNRSVGVRLGQGEALQDILASSPQVAEGVPTAAVVISLARRFRISLPVLTAIAQILEGNISPKVEAVNEIMGLPQMKEDA